jgi:hypothetical protein
MKTLCFFHNYANYRKIVNTIWEMKRIDGKKAKTFQEIINMGVSFYKFIYSKSNRVNMAEILKISSFFPRLVTKEGNHITNGRVIQIEVKLYLNVLEFWLN